MAAPVAIDTRGLADLQRDLRRMAPVVARGVTATLRGIAKDVGMVAREHAAADVSRSGAKTIKWSAARGQASIYTDLYWMRFHEYGFFPGGGSTYYPGARFMERARDEKAEDTLEQVNNLLETTARRIGGFK
jgi:hypothetical protein